MPKYQLYSKEIMKHFKKPQNVGKIKDYDGLGKAGNLKCGDAMHLYIKAGKNKKGEDIIKNISFETFGCSVAIANTSLLTTLAKGKTISQALKITQQDLLKKFGNVPVVKIHCSMLAVDALSEAIYDYLSRNKEKIPGKLEQKHRVVQKKEKTIEKKYKEWLLPEKKK